MAITEHSGGAQSEQVGPICAIAFDMLKPLTETNASTCAFTGRCMELR